jgi:hypothetical protein
MLILLYFLILWVFQAYSPKNGLYLISWEEGAKGTEVCSWKKIKYIYNTLYSHTKVPRAMKFFSIKIKDM